MQRNDDMVRTISTRDAETNTTSLLDSVWETGEAILVEQDGEPYAVIISPADFALFERLRDAPWLVIDAIRAQNAHFDPDVILDIVTAEVEQVRSEGRDEAEATSGRH
jgi:PHD/YefM family antitoxin component YafN of YafNO toxin-antitoxin module